MKLGRWLRRSLLAAVLALPVAAWAQQAFTSQDVNLRAGPASGYPMVAWIPGGQPITVFGCLDGFTWCDVAVPGARGWVFANFISYPFQAGFVPIFTYGPALGIPLITFNLNAYWGSFYVGRPWFHRRDYWAGWRAPVYRPAFRPPGWVPAPPPPMQRPPVRPRPPIGQIRPPGPPSGNRPSTPNTRPPAPPSGNRPGTRPPAPPNPGTRPPAPPPGNVRPPNPAPGPSGPTARPPARPQPPQQNVRPPQPAPQPPGAGGGGGRPSPGGNAGGGNRPNDNAGNNRPGGGGNAGGGRPARDTRRPEAGN